MEGHGTSTSVGDAVELNSLMEAFSGAAATRLDRARLREVQHRPPQGGGGSGGHAQGHARPARQGPAPSINFERPNPNLDWTVSPFAVNTELRDWELAPGRSRVAGVSAFGFGGTNFHVVMEEYVPGRHAADGNGHRTSVAVPAEPALPKTPEPAAQVSAPPRPQASALQLGKPPQRGSGARRGGRGRTRKRAGRSSPRRARVATSSPPPRVATRCGAPGADRHFADGPELVTKAELALRMQSGNASAWPRCARGIHRGSGAPGRVAFLYTGQGSQYVNMLGELRRREPVVADTFDEADAIMAPLLEGSRLSDIMFADPADPDAMARAEKEPPYRDPAAGRDHRRHRAHAPARRVRDRARHGDGPLGRRVRRTRERRGLSFHDAIEAVSARGREMASLRVEDRGDGRRAALARGGRGDRRGDRRLRRARTSTPRTRSCSAAPPRPRARPWRRSGRGHTAIPLPVSHGFHTEIVAPASTPLRAMLQRLGLRAPTLPTIANISGEFYPTGEAPRNRCSTSSAARWRPRCSS